MKSKTQPDRFKLSSDDCELILAFAEGGSLSDLAERLGRDISVVSRQMKRLAERGPVLEKNGGRWRTTAVGDQLVQWAREAMRTQAGLLEGRRTLSIVTTHEFGSRILAPGLRELLGEEKVIPSVHCAEASIEPLLLAGRTEIGFDCGRPESPLIKFKQVRREPLCIVAAPEFCRRHRAKNWEALVDTPYLEYSRLSAVRHLNLKNELPSGSGVFNTIAAARSAAIAGLGWTLLPLYAVSHEARAGELQVFVPETISHEQFGVWWLRGAVETERVWIPRAVAWLSRQELG